jgi:hypothetical protein
MNVRIHEMTSELLAPTEPGGAQGATPGEMPWQELSRERKLEARVERDRARTRARDFDA